MYQEIEIDVFIRNSVKLNIKANSKASCYNPYTYAYILSIRILLEHLINFFMISEEKRADWSPDGKRLQLLILATQEF